jgi:hypothetical protein
VTEPAWTGLGDAVAAIRRELEQAISEGADSALKFRTGPVELELATAIHTDAEGRVKVLLLPWSAQGRADRAADRSQRIKFTLQPIDPETGEDREISGRSDRRPE